MSPPTEADTQVADMDAKLMVATGSGGVQQLKDLVNKQEKQDSEVMVVVLAKKQAAAASAQKPHMDPHLLALASSGSSEELESFLGSSGISSSADDNGSKDDDIEANNSILLGVTAEGNTALHVVAACGEGNSYLKSARIIHEKYKDLLFAPNSNGDTPLHCAARAGNYDMVNCLIQLASEDKIKEELLEKQNKHKETALHEAVRSGNDLIVNLLMYEDPELASVPQDGGASPMYLAIVLRRYYIVETLYAKSSPGKLSFAGPNGENALHATVLRYPHRYGRHQDPTKLLQNKDLATQGDRNGSTPLHFAAARDFRFWPRTCRQELLAANPDAGTIKSRIFQMWTPSICWQVLEANPDALYQPDHAGFFPIHVAASVGASWNVDMFIKRYPGSASLRDGEGRTFLHVAVEKKKVNVIRNACRNVTLSWIMNMVDNDGNTALHLAVEAGSLHMFCYLLENLEVNLNVPNKKGETPLDIAEDRIPQGMFYNQNSEAQICSTLRIAGAVNGVRRWDHLLEDNKTLKVKHNESKDSEVLKDSTQAMAIGSVLVTTVTFGATFAVPGGYIADDHSNGGSPILAQSTAFHAFIASNTLAFIFSALATIGLMFAGSPLVSPRSRKIHLGTAFYLLNISLTSLTAAFGLGAYAVLAPVSHKTAVVIYALSLLVPLYPSVEFIWRRHLLQAPLSMRKGPSWSFGYTLKCIMVNLLLHYWPLFVIYGWAGRAI